MCCILCLNYGQMRCHVPRYVPIIPRQGCAAALTTKYWGGKLLSASQHHSWNLLWTLEVVGDKKVDLEVACRRSGGHFRYLGIYHNINSLYFLEFSASQHALRKSLSQSLTMELERVLKLCQVIKSGVLNWTFHGPQALSMFITTSFLHIFYFKQSLLKWSSNFQAGLFGF